MSYGDCGKGRYAVVVVLHGTSLLEDGLGCLL